ncbi:ribbon-helix-helix domain-containing protein [Candidatus Puniceispirillum sp.]|nr:ribbon-helix-helix domain-containing protein [Candidatus Puniceispirillum sp.]
MIKKRSITIQGHRTSISLEEPFWIILQNIAAHRCLSMASLVQIIDQDRNCGLSSALRLFILAELVQNNAGDTTITRPLGH